MSTGVTIHTFHPPSRNACRVPIGRFCRFNRCSLEMTNSDGILNRLIRIQDDMSRHQRDDTLRSRRPLAMTSSEAPISAAIAPHREATPQNVRPTNAALTANEKAMF